MFWGLIMEPNRRYTQTVKKPFHISMAALDISTSSDEPAQIMCGFEGRNYLLCTLRKPDLMQCQLDLNFDVGSEVSFASNGKCHVHLTGYLTEEMMGMEEIEEEEEDESFVPSTQSKKRNIKAVENGPPTKKVKKVAEVEDSDEDSDNYVDKLMKSELGSDEEEDSDADLDENEEEESGEEEEDSGEEQEEEESSLSDEEEEEEITVSKVKKQPKLNGMDKSPQKESKKEKKEKQKEKQKEAKSPGKELNTTKEGKTPNKDGKQKEQPKKKVLNGNVVIEELREGQGQVAKAGRVVHVYYEGRLKNNNKMFDSTTQGPGFKFRLGSSEVIKGWDVGLAGMKVGGKRRVICPPNMAYGPKGSPPAIPPNSTLVFDVELKKVS